MISIPQSKSSTATKRRTCITLHSDGPIYHIPPRDPLLPPPTRSSEFPMSSQSQGESSPLRPNVKLEGERKSTRAEDHHVMEDSRGAEDEEDEFDGIEDVSASQFILPNPPAIAKKGLTLDDLFSDDESDIEAKENWPIAGSSKGSEQPISKMHFHTSSPAFASSSLTSKQRYYQSDTPPSPLPRTPHTDIDTHDQGNWNGDDGTMVEWTPSPMSQRTKARRTGAANGGIHESPLRQTGDPDLEILDPPKSRTLPTPKLKQSTRIASGTATSVKTKSKGKAVMQDSDCMDLDADDGPAGYDDFDDGDFFSGVDLDSLDPPITSTSTSNSGPETSSTKESSKSSSSHIHKIDPGLAFRPSTSTRQTRPSSSSPRESSPPSDIIAMLDNDLRPDRLMFVSELSAAEQDFYRNHWRRGADKGSKKRAQQDAEDEWSDGEFRGPEPSKKKVFKPPARKGFRGRGRGRGRGRK